MMSSAMNRSEPVLRTVRARQGLNIEKRAIHRMTLFSISLRARDGIRTRDPRLGKAILHHWATRAHIPSKPHIEIIFTVSQPTRPSWISPRPISNSQLRTLLHFHLCPIYLVVFKGSYFFRMGYLILRGASRLDAFSVYPCQTWLPGHELSSSTGTPAVRPSRSSRTKDSSSQISSACAG